MTAAVISPLAWPNQTPTKKLEILAYSGQ